MRQLSGLRGKLIAANVAIVISVDIGKSAV